MSVSDYAEVVAALLFFFAPIVICALKGKWGFAIVGLVFHIFPLIGMFRLAKPRSLWARKWYGDDKRAASAARFPSKAKASAA